MNGMCGIDPDRGPLARSIRPYSTPARWAGPKNHGPFPADASPRRTSLSTKN